MCRYYGGQDISCAGVHSSMFELTSLAIQPFHLLSSLINPNVFFAWLNFDMSLAMCEPIVVPLFLMGIMPNMGVAVLPRY